MRAKGPTMGLAYKPIKQDPVPGPLAYQPNCDGRCSQCDGYKGASFGMRTQMWACESGGGGGGGAAARALWPASCCAACPLCTEARAIPLGQRLWGPSAPRAGCD